MNKKQIFFMDMDGVITDFVPAALKLFGIEYDEATWPKGQYGIDIAMKIDDSEMWKRIDATPNFWENLPERLEGIYLYEKLSQIGEVVFLTSPCRDPMSSAGKVKWLLKMFGPKFRNYILTSKKHHCAGNGILIDDYDEKVNDFRANGGTAIVYPQPWNSKHDFQYDRNGYVLEQLHIIMNCDTNHNMKEQILPIRMFLEVADHIKHVIESKLNWEEKYDLIFSSKIQDGIRNSGVHVEWCDPDASYEDDVLAFANAVEDKANKLRV